MHLNLPTLLDVAIGLIFIFFVFSIFVSGVVELINTLFQSKRAEFLRLAIDKLLGASLADAFFSHRLTSIKQQDYRGLKPISYLSADSFSTVLIDLLSKAGHKVGPVDATAVGTTQTLAAIRQGMEHGSLADVKELIEPMLAKSDSFQSFKDALERWYNGYMEQVSGWYKRYAQGVAWLVSLVVVLVFNVDTIYLTNRLFNDTDLRGRLVADAINATKTGKATYGKDRAFIDYLVDNKSAVLNTTKSALKDTLTDSEKLMVQSAYVKFVQGQIDELQLPISWKQGDGKWGFQPGQEWYVAIVGWVLTMAALSFGAPFWFDLLLKLVNIRNTARRPPGNPDPTK
ncbi:hypothetical protein J2I47_05515 [Fibrella sp. HMF5335]|uniref:Uncharacterized protein n=1 Tax=Fibrella rubiginis TaxID=2817060 RepID=A0A939GDX4_9BACT|nr:hypothetical protein [Fibrella rubiginis]MBO0935998.1 hypothetical protein [Fibrella rubiginis]